MKKIILASFFLLSILSFSRYIKRCKVIDPHRCKSLSSGKIYHFSEPSFYGRGMYGEIVHVTFDGEGYKNLNTIDVDRTN
jgi:hypothetical protein